MEYQNQILEFKSEEKEFTASTLIKSKEEKRVKTVHDFYSELIEEMELAGKIGNSRVYKDSFRSLESYYNDKLDITFSVKIEIKVDILLKN